MKRPSFQFYPGDWQANSNLRRCTHEEKGIWIDVMCLLHDQEEYGVVRWPLKEIAQAIGCTVQKVRGLVSKGVLKGADDKEDCSPLIYIPRSGRKDGAPVTLIPQQSGPIWFSSRMVEDEYKRVLRGEHGATPKPTPDPSPSRARASSSSSSSPSGKPTEGEVEFVDQPAEDESTAGNATRVGALCKQLRVIGIDAAPHLPVWHELLDRFTDEQIVAVAEIAKARKPDERLHLHYLVPILNEPPKAPASGKRKPAHDNFENRDYGQGGRL